MNILNKREGNCLHANILFEFQFLMCPHEGCAEAYKKKASLVEHMQNKHLTVKNVALEQANKVVMSLKEEEQNKMVQ